MRAIVKADPKTGNDPLEAYAWFMEMPRVGEQIEVELPTGRIRLQVWMNVHTPEDVEIWVELDDYSLVTLEAAVAVIDDQFVEGR